MKHIKQDYSLRPESDPLGRVRMLGQDQNSAFSENGHVAYKVKGNEVYNNTLA